MIFLHHPV